MAAAVSISAVTASFTTLSSLQNSSTKATSTGVAMPAFHGLKATFGASSPASDLFALITPSHSVAASSASRNVLTITADVATNIAAGKVTCEKSATVLTPPLKQLTLSEPKVAHKFVKAFAPATVANLGPGFDFLGCAVDGLGDFVTAEVSEEVPAGEIQIEAITGDSGRLSLVPGDNCAGIAGKATLELLGVKSVGIILNLHKGLPLGSGLGSSAASAAAAAAAVNGLFGSPLSKAELVQAGLESEATVSGYHADNIAPSLMGGFVLVRSYTPLDLIPLAFPSEKDLYFVLVIPDFEAPTREMRAALPTEISMKKHIANCSQASALVTAILQGKPDLLGAALSSDSIVEPKRAVLIPGMSEVIAASEFAHAYGCTISGAGPTAVAITDSAEKGAAIAAAMVEAFKVHGGLNAEFHVNKLDREGARIIECK